MAQVMFFRYVDDFEAALIRQNRRIEPSPGRVFKWYTPDRYDRGADAQRFLAMACTPTYRVGPIPSDELPDSDVPLRVVGSANTQPGGGVEAATTKTAYLFDIIAIP